MTNNEDFYQRIAPAKAVAIAVMPRDEALRLLRNESKGAPEWTYRNVTTEAVTVTFGTSLFSPKHSAFVAGPDVRIVWQPDEEIAIPASMANCLHQIIVSPGGRPLCVGGQAPISLTRVSPPVDYETHPSLRRDPAAERAAITRPKSWAKPESDR